MAVNRLENGPLSLSGRTEFDSLAFLHILYCSVKLRALLWTRRLNGQMESSTEWSVAVSKTATRRKA